MKRFICILLFVLSLSLAITGCSSKPKKFGEFEKAAKMVPCTTYAFYYYNVSELKRDKNLNFIIKCELSPTNEINITSKEIIVADYFSIYIGKYNKTKIINYFKNNLYSEEHYGGVILEVGRNTIALCNGKIISGKYLNVKRCIDVMNHDLPSLYDSRDFKDIVKRVPHGPIMIVLRHPGIDENITIVCVSVLSHGNVVSVYGAIKYESENS